MQEVNPIKLSFDDSKTTVTRRGKKTIVRLTSYFDVRKFVELFGGQPNLYDRLFDLGYEYLGGNAVNVTRGVVELQDGDTDNPDAAVRIAATKAKVKAYDRYYRFVTSVIESTIDSLKGVETIQSTIARYHDEELKALDRCIKTGYCDPKRG